MPYPDHTMFSWGQLLWLFGIMWNASKEEDLNDITYMGLFMFHNGVGVHFCLLSLNFKIFSCGKFEASGFFLTVFIKFNLSFFT